MLRKVLVTSMFVLALAAAAGAQTKVNFAGQCAKPDLMNAIPIADRPNHAYAISQAKCTYTKSAEIGGAKATSAVGWTTDEIRGDSDRFHGYFEETWSNGDKILYTYEGKGTLKAGAFQGADETWSVIRGTGAHKGVKGKGTCKVTGNADGTVTFDCEGELQHPAPKPATPAKKAK